MQSIEIRNELRSIQRELRQPLDAAAHKIRELPGTSDLYIYLPWQAVRDRLEEVVPDYELGFSDPVYDHTANLVSIQATIEILGVKKSAIAGVKISIISKKGNNAEIGHCLDRLHAEAIKNAGEAWCIGRYLDDQLSVYKLLWDNQSELDPEMRGKLNQMKNQFAKQLREYTTPQKSNQSAPKPTKKAEPTSTAVKAQEEAEELYPQHNSFFNTFAEAFKFKGIYDFAKQVIAANWKGRSRPGHLGQGELEALMEVIAAQWGVETGVFESFNLAQTSYQGRLAILKGKGEYTIGEARDWAIAWRNAQLSNKKQLVGVE